MDDGHPRGHHRRQRHEAPAIPRGQEENRRQIEHMNQQLREKRCRGSSAGAAQDSQLADEQNRDRGNGGSPAPERDPSERKRAHGRRRQHDRQTPLGRSRRAGPRGDDQRRSDDACRVQRRRSRHERRRAGPERHHRQRAEDRPWRKRPFTVGRNQEEEHVADERQIQPLCRTARPTRPGRRRQRRDGLPMRARRG